jgi:endonuclease YncB( thermonuclease family)
MRGMAILILLILIAIPARAELAGPARAIAGDTLVVAGTLVRLAGIDAPEFDQTCSRGEETWSCGDAAAQVLAAAVAEGEVVCRAEEAIGEDTVRARCDSGGRDLALQVLAAGFAVNRAPDDPVYRAAEGDARAAALGIWSGEFMDPERWRQAMACSCSARKKAFARNAAAKPGEDSGEP